MKNKYIRILVLFGTVSLIGILVVQIFWLLKAFDLREKQFNYNVNLALDNVVRALCDYNETDVPSDNPVEQVSSNYYVVRTNSLLVSPVLESLLETEFRKRVINTDFEYTIYDCRNQKVVHKDYVNLDNRQTPGNRTVNARIPDLPENEYYFGVFFPHKTAGIVNQMGVWVFSTSVLIVVVVVFAFALLIIFRQKRMTEIQRDFVNNVAHEFNTPIASISLAANYFRQQETMQQVRKSGTYLDIIEKENRKLKKHVEEILQVGRYEEESVKLSCEPCNPLELLQEAHQDYQVNAAGSSIEVTYEDTGMKGCQVNADRYHLKNVLYNLLENVGKYVPDNPQVTVSCIRQGNKTHLLFGDNGHGIPRKYQSRIFNRFFRVPKQDTAQTKGFGIGLFYARFIMKKMNGSIKLVNSGPDGTTFQLTLKNY